MVEIIVAVVTGVATVLAVVITNTKSNREIDAKLEKKLAITDTKVDELMREVREQRTFTQKVPVLEEQMRGVNNRLDILEVYHREAN